MNIWIYIIVGIFVANLLSMMSWKAREYWKECLSTAIEGISKKIKRKNILLQSAFLFYYFLVLVLMLAFLLLVSPIATVQLMLNKKVHLFQRKNKSKEKVRNIVHYRHSLDYEDEDDIPF